MNKNKQVWTFKSLLADPLKNNSPEASTPIFLKDKHSASPEKIVVAMWKCRLNFW